MILKNFIEAEIGKSDVDAIDPHTDVVRNSSDMVTGMLSGFEILSSDEIEISRFRKRFITKYLVPVHLLDNIINECRSNYKLLECCGELQPEISLEYYDTAGLQFFNDHVNGKLNRVKVRIRSSCKPNTRVWEIWRRKSKGRMVKKRFPFTDSQHEVEDMAGVMLSKYAGIDFKSLKPSLLAEYRRVTLLNPERKERITVDTNICFASPKYPEQQKHVDGLVIIEIRKRRRASSFLAELLAKNSIRPVKISKYCLGISLTNRCAKTNSYKPIIRNIEKINLHG